MSLRQALPWVVLVVVLGGFGAYEYELHHPDDVRGPVALATPTASGASGVVTGDRPVVGACYETREAATKASDTTPEPRTCDGLHNTVAVAEHRYPAAGVDYDEQAVLDEGRSLCKPDDEAFVAGSDARYTFLSIYPGKQDWLLGERVVSCLVRREGPDLTGDLSAQ